MSCVRTFSYLVAFGENTAIRVVCCIYTDGAAQTHTLDIHEHDVFRHCVAIAKPHVLDTNRQITNQNYNHVFVHVRHCRFVSFGYSSLVPPSHTGIYDNNPTTPQHDHNQNQDHNHDYNRRQRRLSELAFVGCRFRLLRRVMWCRASYCERRVR